MIRRFDLDDDLMGYALGTGPQACGVKRYWMEPNDLKHHWSEHQRDPVKLQYLRQQGWLHPQAIEYNVNIHGFRGEDFTGVVDAVALGCSYTFGHALPQDQMWTWELTQTLGIKIANLGINGAGVASCFRVLKYWLPRLKPKWIFFLLPHLNRLEVVISDMSSRMYAGIYHPGSTQDSDKFLRDYWLTDYNALLERERSILAMKYLAEANQSHIIILPVEQAEQQFWQANDLARDFSHPGPVFQQRVADFFRTEMQKRHDQE